MFPSTKILLRFIVVVVFFVSTLISTTSAAQTTQQQQLILKKSNLSLQAACKASLYPNHCVKVLSAAAPFATNLADFSRFSLLRSLGRARDSSAAFSRYLRQLRGRPSPLLRPNDVAALEDCRFFSDLSVDLLSSVQAEFNDSISATTVTEPKQDRIGAYLGAIIANHRTCLDGLKASSSALYGEFSGRLSRDAIFHSASLAVVPHTLHSHWRRYRRRGGMIKEPKGYVPPEETVPRGNTTLRGMVTVSKDGAGNFSTVKEAIAAAPVNAGKEDDYFLILVKEGIYEEYVTVEWSKSYIMMVGDGIGRTIISGNHSVGDGFQTASSFTFAVFGEGFVATGISFRNTAGPEKHQAVAVMNGADRSVFHRCSFEGYQDTLYAHSLHQFYRNCDIYGTVDFIFGQAIAVFQNCNIYARKALDYQRNAITAQGRTEPSQPSGFVIQNCIIKPSPEFVGNMADFTDSYLGRPWKMYSTTVFMNSYIDGFINPAGWLEWKGDFALRTLYYGEFRNFGPGANTSRRVHWPGFRVMDTEEAMKFTVSNFIHGDSWLPSRPVSFVSGLLRR